MISGVRADSIGPSIFAIMTRDLFAMARVGTVIITAADCLRFTLRRATPTQWSTTLWS